MYATGGIFSRSRDVMKSSFEQHALNNSLKITRKSKGEIKNEKKSKHSGNRRGGQ